MAARVELFGVEIDPLRMRQAGELIERGMQRIDWRATR